MMIFAKANSAKNLFKQSFVSLFESKNNPSMPELCRDESAVLILEGSVVDPYISFDKPLAKTDLDYDYLVDKGNERFEIEYWHYYYELFQSGKIDSLISHLKSNPFTKRGVVGLWEEKYRDSKQSAPCLINLTFLIRNNKVNVSSHMRANDAYRIFLIDFHILRSVQKYVSERLDLGVGTYIHFVDTLHIYKKDESLAERLYKTLQR